MSIRYIKIHLNYLFQLKNRHEKGLTRLHLLSEMYKNTFFDFLTLFLSFCSGRFINRTSELIETSMLSEEMECNHSVREMKNFSFEDLTRKLFIYIYTYIEIYLI